MSGAMFWSTVGRILLARWLIVATVTLGSLAGGLIVVVMADREYDATARVMLNISVPDPITGAKLNRRNIEPYLQSQLSFIRDLQVVGRAVEAIGWLDDPEILAEYSASGDPRPPVVWLGMSVAANVQTSLVEGSNIIEIRYRGLSPEVASLVAGAIRDAYIAGSISERRASAAADADAQSERAERLRTELSKLQSQKLAMERETGIILAANGTDLDTDRLIALAGPPKPGAVEPVFAKPASLRGQLNQLDLELAQATGVLGPNHPRLQQLRTMRASLAAQTSTEERSAGGVAATMVGAERAKAAAFESQKARVLDQRQNLIRLRLVQDQINLKGKALEEALTRVSYLRQLGTSTESGLTSVGTVKNVPGVAFPNVALILAGTGGLGLLGGILAGLLVEMFNFRVRTVGSLRILARMPVLGTIPTLRDDVRKRRRLRVRRLKPASA